MSHTPGPYRKGRARTVVSDSKDGITIEGAADEQGVEYYGGALIAESVSPNNIPLLSAAPELLEALEEVLRGCRQCRQGADNGCEGLGDAQTCCGALKRARAAIAKARATT